MNIFVLDQDPYIAAEQHCDRHVVKMVLEYSQMLSTAHRLRDADPKVFSGHLKAKKLWLFPHESVTVSEQGKWVIKDPVCYQVAHANHPCSVWARETDANYHWLFMLFDGLLQEYTHRYGRVHSTARLLGFLRRAPMQVPRGPLTPFVQAMPDEHKHEDAVQAYHRFYVKSKSRFARWTNRDIPQWFERALEGQDVSIFKRTR